MKSSSLWRATYVLCSILAALTSIALTAQDPSTDPVDFVGPLPSKAVYSDDYVLNLAENLQLLARVAGTDPDQARAYSEVHGIALLPSGDVEVVVAPFVGASESIPESEIMAAGAKVVAQSRSLLRLVVSPKQLLELAEVLSGVAYVRLPAAPEVAKVDISEGVVATGASTYHAAGQDGSGVRIAVIDVGFQGLDAAIASGDIAGGRIVFQHNFQTGQDVVGGPSNHGRDCAEIVHDMAPGADLCLMQIGDELDLENAKDAAISLGVDVISCSLGWFNFAYYDGTGLISNIASDARDHGILWVNSAGNHARNHWQGEFEDPDADGRLDFVYGDEIQNITDSDQAAGLTIKIWMTWDAWPDDPEDYDLYLFHRSGSQWNEVASSTTRQVGSGVAPTEAIGYITIDQGGRFGFQVVAHDAPSHPQIDVFVKVQELFGPDVTAMEYGVEQRSILDPGNDQKVLTVGAVDYRNWETGPQEPFSSQGPSNTSKFLSSARQKPDLVGPDGVSTSGYASIPPGYSFYGTSASCPHVAGAAALLLDENPWLSAPDLMDRLKDTAIFMGDWHMYGEGRLSLVHTPITGGCGGPLAETEWPMLQGGNEHTGYSSHAGPTRPRKKWEYPTDWSSGGFLASPVFGIDGYLYVPDDRGTIYRINPSDGIGREFHELGYKVAGSLAVAQDGTLYATSYGNGIVFAVNPDGSRRWTNNTLEPDIFYGSPAIGGDGTVYVGSGFTFYALDCETGDINYVDRVGDHVQSSSPAVTQIDGEERILCGATTGRIYCFTPQLNWAWTFPATGSAAGGFRNPVSVSSDGTIYAQSDSRLYAINPDGSGKWSNDLGAGVNDRGTAPAIGPDGTLYVISRSGGNPDNVNLVAVDPADGEVLWEGHFTNQWQVYTSPTVDRAGIVYISDDYSTYAIKDGALLWSQSGGGEFSAPIIGPDGTLYVGSSYMDRIYAFEETNSPPVAVASSSNPVPEIGEPVSLDGSGSSDPDQGDSVASAFWTLLKAPCGSCCTIANPESLVASIIPDVGGVYEIELRVRDTGTLECTDQLLLFVETSAVFRVDACGSVFLDKDMYARAFESSAADVAEWVAVSEPVAAGDVLELDPNAIATHRLSQATCSTLVAGVVSSEPGFTLGRGLTDDGQALLALIGIVPVKVTNEGGPILPGDLLVTSSTPGHAMRWAGPDSCPCSLVGKALEPMTESEGVILVLLTAH